ncbi:MAG: HIT domain-containing protein, partial [Octadecabacter sp.]
SMDHFCRDGSADEVVGFMRAVGKVCEVVGVESGFRAITNVREHGAQEVPHLHFHILAGRHLGPLLTT